MSLVRGEHNITLYISHIPAYRWRLSSGVEDSPSNKVKRDTSPEDNILANVSTGRILVVEDESIVALDLRNTLQYYGHTVVAVVNNGSDAISQARRHHPDVILMDIRLRGAMNGIEAAEIITSELKIPIIFMTAQTDASTRARAEMTMPAGYMVKPFVKHEMASLIATVLGGSTH